MASTIPVVPIAIKVMIARNFINMQSTVSRLQPGTRAPPKWWRDGVYIGKLHTPTLEYVVSTSLRILRALPRGCKGITYMLGITGCGPGCVYVCGRAAVTMICTIACVVVYRDWMQSMRRGRVCMRTKIVLYTFARRDAPRTLLSIVHFPITL